MCEDDWRYDEEVGRWFMTDGSVTSSDDDAALLPNSSGNYSLKFTKHAQERMIERGITVRDVEDYFVNNFTSKKIVVRYIINKDIMTTTVITVFLQPRFCQCCKNIVTSMRIVACSNGHKYCKDCLEEVNSTMNNPKLSCPSCQIWEK